jgi:hypothetical protein
MKPQISPQNEPTQFQLFQARLDSQLNSDHPLYQLANIIQWERFDEAYAPFYCEDNGAPGLPTRLMVGLEYQERRQTAVSRRQQISLLSLLDSAAICRLLDASVPKNLNSFSKRPFALLKKRNALPTPIYRASSLTQLFKKRTSLFRLNQNFFSKRSSS